MTKKFWGGIAKILGEGSNIFGDGMVKILEGSVGSEWQNFRCSKKILGSRLQKCFRRLGGTIF